MTVSITTRLLLDQSKAFSIDQIQFSINLKSHRAFFKNFEFSLVQSLSNFFKTLFSLSSIGQGFKSLFLLFSLKFLQGFLSSKAGKTFLPLLFSFIFMFHALFHAFQGECQTYENLGFLLISFNSFKINHWVFVMGCY